MKILMVLTSHSELGNTGKTTGFWLEEFAAPVIRHQGVRHMQVTNSKLLSQEAS
jgi:hypothetical protein